MHFQIAWGPKLSEPIIFSTLFDTYRHSTALSIYNHHKSLTNQNPNAATYTTYPYIPQITKTPRQKQNQKKKKITTMCPSGRSLRQHASNSDFRPAFDILDADSDGKISRDDLRAFYGGICGGASGGDDVIGAMMSVADTNRDGFVEYEEFERVVAGNGEKKPLGCGAMEEVFRVMDRDGDGKLSHQDLKSYMAWAGFAATDEDINAMIKFGGGDQNGGVSFDGLLRILAIDHSAAAN